MSKDNDNLTRVELHNYKNFLNQAKTRISDTQLRIVKSANRELIQLYWWLGEHIFINQQSYSWGNSVVEQFSKDLIASHPGYSGFSVRNLWNMRKFYLEYKNYPELQQLVAEIPWGQNLLILQKVKDIAARKYYLTAVFELAWSRNVLLLQIQSQTYERHKLLPKQHNFEKALPPHLVAQADDAMKDVYMLDMLGITQPIVEAELEKRMVEKIKEVLMELGRGFTFMGNQYRIVAEGREYRIDLLFFNRRLRAMVALEIKLGAFKPEYAGKMNFYLGLLNKYVREEGENPTIGIILCSDRDHFEVEFALQDIDKPIGVAQYQLTRELPNNLQDILPDPKQLEETLKFELGVNDISLEDIKLPEDPL